MESVLRAAAIYVFVLALIRVSGRRTLAEISTFDFVMLLVVGEATGNAMLGRDESVTNCLLVILTMAGLNVVLSLLELRWHRLDRWVHGTPLVIVDRGRPLHDRMRSARIEPEDILEAARLIHGLERMEQIKYAVLERNGGISIIPQPGTTA